MTTIENNNENECMETKKERVWDRLSRREEERLADVGKKRAERENSSVINEQTSYFNETFSKAKVDLLSNLAKSNEIPKSELSDNFESVSKHIQKLQKYLSESVIFLPAYDVRVTQETLKELQEKLQEQQNLLLPKKKFAFKTRRKDNSEKKPEEALVKPLVKPDDPVKSADAVDFAHYLYDCGFRDLAGQKVSETETNDKDVSLSRLTDCVVSLYGFPSTVHMSGLRKCRILCGPVRTSVFIEDCEDCVFVVACQQLRCHTTLNSDLYLHVTSNPIIEDCNNVRFAPYNLDYPDIETHFSAAGLDKNRNNWSQVNDFNWLAADAHSPNWSTIPELDRIHDWCLE